MIDTTSTLIRVRADFFANKNQVAFKAQNATYAVRKAEDFALTPTNTYAKSNTLRFFDDDKQVSLNLSDKTINFLQKHFVNSNFIALEDGSIGLKGDAAVFVEGWYKDIVYNRGFVGVVCGKRFPTHLVHVKVEISEEIIAYKKSKPYCSGFSCEKINVVF